MKRFLLIVTQLLAFVCYAQKEVSLKEYLEELESRSGKTFFYQEKWIDSIYVSTGNSDYLKVIGEAIADYGLKTFVHKDEFIFIYPNRLEFEKTARLKNSIEDRSPSDVGRIGSPDSLDINKTYLLRGNVTNQTLENLVGVNITVDNKLAARTDEKGNYQLELKPGNYELKYSYIGLESESKFITFYSSGDLDVSLFPTRRLLDEVVVEGNYFDQSSEKSLVGVQKISVAKLEKLPSFGGNIDVVKSATSLPGVTVSSESSSYLNIRGGGNDQTLTLMNNTTIFNPGHLLGFFSVFNGDFISDVTLYKGSIPAKYGMRSSSVLDVKMNKWARKKLNVYGGIGIVDSNLGVKTKLLDDKLDIHVGGRISYVDWVFDLVPDKEIIQSSAQFGDVNFSSRYILNDKNSLFVSGYFGKDRFRYSDRIIYKWRTLNNQVKWTSVLGKDWILETEMLMSNLTNSSEGLELNDEFVFENGISEISGKALISNEFFEGGIDLTSYTIDLGVINPTATNSLVRPQTLDTEDVINIGVHGSYTYNLNDNFAITPGIRFNYFVNYGPSSINVYESGQPTVDQNLVSIREFGNGELESSRTALEPRLGLKYQWGNHTIRGGYSRVNQFLHLISNTVLVNPSTVWKSSDRYIPPTRIDQFALGYQYDIQQRDISFSIDGFYKNLTDLVEYRDGATLVLNDNLEQDILRGEGTFYGIEAQVSKNKGSLTGLVSYTYSRSFVKVDDVLQGVQINSGKRYPYYSDRPHSFKANLDLKLSKKWTITSNFTYVSGSPISAPISVFEIEDVSIPLFGERNAERIPDYHRLDLVITLKSRIRKTKKNNDRWVLTFYNLYSRDNIATIFFSSENNLPAQPFGLVNVGRMIPTLTYKFEF